jgi:hypothetical protein
MQSQLYSNIRKFSANFSEATESSIDTELFSKLLASHDLNLSISLASAPFLADIDLKNWLVELPLGRIPVFATFKVSGFGLKKTFYAGGSMTSASFSLDSFKKWLCFKVVCCIKGF